MSTARAAELEGNRHDEHRAISWSTSAGVVAASAHVAQHLASNPR